jgi:hypothetical protein
MPNWKKVVTSGSNAAFSSLIVSSTITGSISGSLTGSLFGTASFVSGSTTVGNNLITLPNPNAVTYLRVNANNTVTARTPTQVISDLGISTSLILGRDFIGANASNTTANTIVFSTEIPANTLQVNDFIELFSQLNSNVPNGTATTWRVYVNTSAAIGGTQIATWNNTVATNNVGFLRNIFITAAGASGNLRISPTTGNLITPYVNGSISASNVTINTTVSLFIVIAVQMDNNTSTAGVQGTIIKLTR